MHFFVLTDEEENPEEKFWPEGHKKVINAEVTKVIFDQFIRRRSFVKTYLTHYSSTYKEYTEFIASLAHIVAIGAENGTDEIFDEIYSIPEHNAYLPKIRKYARYLWPSVLTKDLESGIEYVVISEYRQEKTYSSTYEQDYKNLFRNFNEFLVYIAKLVTVGAVNGADDALGKIYQAFLKQEELPIIRRRPRRLKLLN